MKCVHGHSSNGKRTSTYISWQRMLARCRATSGPRYLYYAARGITYCQRWERFENFLADMGERPIGTSLDRLDNNGNYEPTNCHWATKSEQMRNRRKIKRRPVTHCKHGHEFTPENTALQHGIFRQCVTCRRIANVRWRLAYPKL